MFTHSYPTREQSVINRPAVFSFCDLTYQVCCCSMLFWPCEHTRPTPTKTKAGRSSLILWCSGSATTWMASSSCCGGHMLRRKELLLTGWVYTVVLIQLDTFNTSFLSCSPVLNIHTLFIETPPHPAGCASFSFVCPSRILWLQAFLESQRAAGEIWEVSHRLEGTLTHCYVWNMCDDQLQTKTHT